MSSFSHIDQISIENLFIEIFLYLLLFIVVFYLNNWEGKSKGARSRGFPVRDDPSQIQGESDRDFYKGFRGTLKARNKLWTEYKDFSWLLISSYI